MKSPVPAADGEELLALMPAGVYTCEAPSGVITYFNERAAELWGRAPRLGDTDDRFCGAYRLWRPDGRLLPHAETPMALAMREGRSCRNQEVVIERPDGSRVTVLVNIDPLHDAEGRITGAINVFHDITEQRAARERLQRSERDLNDFFETAAIGLHWVGPEGIILRVNQAELDLLGYMREEYVGRHIAEFHADADTIADILQRLTCGQTLREYPARLRCKDGTIREVLINSSVLFEEGRFLHTRCFTVDVTERRRAEAGLARQARRQEAIARLGERALAEARLPALFDYAAHVVADTLEVEHCNVLEALPGTAELVLRASVSLPHLLGTTSASGQSAYALASPKPLIARDLRTETRFAPPQHLLEHGARSSITCVVRNRDGSVWGLLAAHADQPDRFGEDDVHFVVAVANVLSEAIHRERAEQALRESDRRKDEFLATLAHELRNPLAPLRNALHLLQLSGRDDAGLEKISGMMERQVNHLVRLVDDLLEMSRISRGAFELRRSRVEVAEVVRNAVETSDPVIRASGHQFSVELPTERLWVHGDPVRLAQILANLLNNAGKYTDAGGRIALVVRREGAEVRFSVTDNGIGIAPEALPRLFEMFSRGGGVERSGRGGLGIGLALARRLAEMHGGTLEASSAGPGRGSEFELTLPLAEQPAADTAQAPAATKAEAMTLRRILVVDDNRDAAESLGMVLKFLGADVRIARDGSEALESLASYSPAVVFLDIGMPGMDGYEVARRIRARFPAGQPKIIALTGWGQEADRRRAREAGFDHHLVKPADLDALQALLASLQPGASLH